MSFTPAPRRMSALALIAASIALLLVVATSADAFDVRRLDVGEASAMLGKPGVVIVDSRYGDDWSEATEKIAGAVRVDPTNVEDATKGWDKSATYVIYCA